MLSIIATLELNMHLKILELRLDIEQIFHRENYPFEWFSSAFEFKRW